MEISGDLGSGGGAPESKSSVFFERYGNVLNTVVVVVHGFVNLLQIIELYTLTGLIIQCANCISIKLIFLNEVSILERKK